MMSTEYPSSGMTSTTASIVEVEACSNNDSSLFKLKRPPSLSDTDELMMTEYDEDNVVVIDLTEDRNSASFKPDGLRQRPQDLFDPSSSGTEVEKVLSAPQLQKTISEDEDVRSLVLEQQQPPFEVLRPESDTLPPVVALKSGSPLKKKSILQRSKTISAPPESSLGSSEESNVAKSNGLNGLSHHDQKVIAIV